MADIIDLILTDHQRIRRLMTVLEEAHRTGRDPAPRRTAADVWDQLADLLDLHINAEEEICYLPMFADSQHAGRLDDAVADHADIREAADQARLHPAGSALWWLAVRSALSACADHLNREESGVLTAFARRADPSLRRELGRQWPAFRAAWTPRADGRTAS